MSGVYGVRGNPNAVNIEPTIAGESEVLDPAYQNPHPAVRIDDPAVGHVFRLPLDKAEDKAEGVREHSDDEEAAEAFARRIDRAIEDAADLWGHRDDPDGGPDTEWPDWVVEVVDSNENVIEYGWPDVDGLMEFLLGEMASSHPGVPADEADRTIRAILEDRYGD